MAKPKVNFSKRDLLLTILCTLFAPANLAAVGSTGRRRAKEVVCLSNLREWGAIFEMLANDNNGYFWDTSTIDWPRGKWITVLQPQYETKADILRCPEATRHQLAAADYGGPFNTYIVRTAPGEQASYGANVWIENPLPGVIEIQNRPTKWNWRTPYIKAAHAIPVFADTMWRGGGPVSGDPREGVIGASEPPMYDGEWSGAGSEMKHFCINRHNGAANHAFMDWSARKVGIKELWTLKWHRSFNTAGPWTRAGGVQPTSWPFWMKDFKDY